MTVWVLHHIIVDGSNIATEGRTVPSLAQLNEAVMALMKEYPSVKVSVVVDATFGHRISKREVAEFNKAVEHNELVAPPAGAVGRGDAFVLAIADKVKGSILSNDSYQEFHGKYKWLFDEGRLIGGKPVPHVGWVFVERVPVRGATSRRSVKTGKVVEKTPTVSAAASKPMPVPKTPPPGAREKQANELLPFLAFVEKHPVGKLVDAIADSYGANGISVRIGDVYGYVPLRNLASPVPRSAREMFKIGDKMQLMIVGYTPSRRSVDLGVPSVVGDSVKANLAKSAAKATPVKKAAKKSAAKKAIAKAVAPAKRAAPVKAAVVKKTAPAKAVPAKKVAAKKAPAKSASPAKKAVAKKAPAKKAAKK